MGPKMYCGLRKSRMTIFTALVLLLVLSSTALAGSGVGGVFNLGQLNTVSGSVTQLVGTMSGNRLFYVKNNATTAGSSAIDAENNSTTAAAFRAKNAGGGPAFTLNVKTNTTPPMITNSTGKVRNLNSDLLDGKDSSAFQGSYKHTVVVSPIGTDAQNGTALLNALARINTDPDKNSATPPVPHLLKIEPGVYDLGTTPLAMKQYVDIEGSGELRTKVTGAGSNATNTGTVVGANNAELRMLTVENRGGSNYAMAIYNLAASPRLTLVTATASGGTWANWGVYNYDSSSPAMTNVTVTASGGHQSFGVYNYKSSPMMTNVTATGSEHGVYNASSSPVMTNVTATGSG